MSQQRSCELACQHKKTLRGLDLNTFERMTGLILICEVKKRFSELEAKIAVRKKKRFV